MRSLTFVTPGAAQAAATASSWSAQELTVPWSVIVPFELSTETLSASSFALRSIAFLMECWTSLVLGAGGTRSISSSTDTTPRMFAATNSASSRSNCQLAVPVSVTTPSSSLASSSLFDKNVVRIGHEETRRLLLRDDDPARPPNEETFQDRRTLEIGGERIDLAWHGPNRSPDNIVIHLPDHDTLMLIDIVNPGSRSACELQRDWAREETVADVVEIVLTERLLQP
jgi:hypothetical protein